MSSSATPSASSTAKSTLQVSGSLKVCTQLALSAASPLTCSCHHLQIVGIILAIVSGVLIGSSFVFKKKGLLRSQAGHAAGEGVAYLKSVRLLLRFYSLGIRTFANSTIAGTMVDRHDQCVVSPCPMFPR
jgi:hypothetical protein